MSPWIIGLLVWFGVSCLSIAFLGWLGYRYEKRKYYGGDRDEGWPIEKNPSPFGPSGRRR